MVHKLPIAGFTQYIKSKLNKTDYELLSYLNQTTKQIKDGSYEHYRKEFMNWLNNFIQRERPYSISIQ